MIFKYESDMKNSSEYIEFLQSFVRDTYGISISDYLIRECPNIPMEPFVFQEGLPYSALIDELKGHIRITLGKLRSYEEDPARLIELREKQARAEVYRRAIEEDEIALAKAEALDAAALNTVVETSAEMISTQERLENALDTEAAAAKAALRAKAILKRDQEKKRERQGSVWRVVQKARKRGVVPNIKRSEKTRRRHEEGFKSATRKARTRF
jgi:hypothetical protein